MNSGCYGEDISKILHSIKAINIQGQEIELAANDINFFYRGTDLTDDLIITSVRLIGKISSKEDIKNKQENLINQKKNLSQIRLKLAEVHLKIQKRKKPGN
jgi:UDP-N-acetylmuramate dehydrogenase